MSDLTTENVYANRSNDNTDNDTIISDTAPSVENREKGGKPVGTIQKQKQKRDEMIVVRKMK